MYYNDKETYLLAMQSLGVQLRLERERQKMDLARIAEETRINLSYLEAIEADDLDALPGEFFYRSFVRQYTKYLGIPATEADKLFESSSALVPPTAGTPEAPTPSFGIYTSKAEEDRSVKALRETLKDKPLRPPQDDGMSRNWLIFAAAVIIACASYFAWRNFSPAVPALPSLAQAPGAEKPAAPAPAPVAPTPVVAAATSEAAPTTTPPNPAPTSPAPTTSAPPVVPSQTVVPPPQTAAVPSIAATSSGSGPVSVTVIAKEMTWIRITADGQKLFGGTIDPGQQRTVKGRDLEIIVGNAGTLDVVYQGKPLSFGTKGQVKTLLFSPEGWKIKPKPPADPAAAPAAPASTGDVAIR